MCAPGPAAPKPAAPCAPSGMCRAGELSLGDRMGGKLQMERVFVYVLGKMMITLVILFLISLLRVKVVVVVYPGLPKCHSLHHVG